MWVRPALSGWEDTRRGDLRCGSPVLEWTNARWNQQFEPHFDSTHSLHWRSLSQGCGTCASLESLKLRSCWEDPSGKTAPAAGRGEQDSDRSQSFKLCGQELVTLQRSHALQHTLDGMCKLKLTDGVPAHRLHVPNHTFTTAHFPPSLCQMHSGSSMGCSLLLRKWFPSTGIPRRSN